MLYKNANNPLKWNINYPIILLLKFKVTPKSGFELYNYNKILKCINIKFYITIYIIINILFILLFI